MVRSASPGVRDGAAPVASERLLTVSTVSGACRTAAFAARAGRRHHVCHAAAYGPVARDLVISLVLVS
jgi:hypothetical protein